MPHRHAPTPSIDRRSFLSGAASLAALASVPSPARARSTTRPRTPAKNLIFAVADGCGPGAIQVGEHYSQLRDGRSLNWTNLFKRPDATTSIITTECANGPVTDSAASASAWAIGELCDYRAVCFTPDRRTPRPLFLRAKDAGKAIGLVATTYIVDATPVAWIGNAPTRYHRTDLAEQLLRARPNVALGSGVKYFEEDAIRDYGHGIRIITEREQLAPFANTPDPLLGLFTHAKFDYRFEYDGEVPELSEMTRVAIKKLKRESPDGFTLLVEGSKVDHAAHRNDGASLCNELAHFDGVLGELIEFTEDDGETLLVVTTDHSNANPALTYYAQEGARAFRNILNATHSFKWCLGEANRQMGVDRSAEAIFERFREGSGLPLEKRDFAMIDRFIRGDQVDGFAYNSKLDTLMGAICANYTGLAFLSPEHTTDPVTATALGPGSELFDPYMHITGIHHKLVAALDLPPAS